MTFVSWNFTTKAALNTKLFVLILGGKQAQNNQSRVFPIRQKIYLLELNIDLAFETISLPRSRF